MIWPWVCSALVLLDGQHCLCSAECIFLLQKTFSNPPILQKIALVLSNAILYVELSEVLLSSSCSHVVGAPGWLQQRAGDKVQELHYS